MQQEPILKSINWTIGLLYCLQLFLFFLVLLLFKISLPYSAILAFVIFLSVLHIGLWIFLSIMHDHFTVIPTGEKLDRINIANKITLFRISSTPFAGFLLLLIPKHRIWPVLVPVILLVFLSDMFDGAIARGNRQITKIGKYLDSISDYSILIVVSFILVKYRMLPDWLFLLILFRYTFQAIGMLSLLIYQGYVHPIATMLGKASVFSTMLLYSAEIVQKIPPIGKSIQFVLPVLEWIVAMIVVVALIEKVIHLKRGFVEAKETRNRMKKSASEKRPGTES
ncbi:MAG: CDP-alcohol phosphatidyltransferase family protein [Spirochaetes bacterium]|nr:CDP-alcohol phosphatidyltransferase family protein [Spirochaetota bacterium]